MVLANKKDIEKKQITNKQIEDFRRANQDIIFYEVSARNGLNILASFTELSEKMLEKGC
jgi:ribosome biogenesis GTPase A